VKFATNTIRLTTAATLLLMALSPLARAQGSDDEGGRRGECRRAARPEGKRCGSEMGVPGVAEPFPDAAGSPAQSDEISLPLALIDEDLGYLQSAVSHLSQAASRGGALDLISVGKTASEVRRRAGRLRDRLALPHPQKGAGLQIKRIIGDAGQMRGALRELSELLADAVRSPVLRGDLLDPAMSAEAWRDLDEIVELSDRIKTGSETLSKTGQ
jgi:hypothetical protein